MSGIKLPKVSEHRSFRTRSSLASADPQQLVKDWSPEQRFVAKQGVSFMPGLSDKLNPDPLA